MSDEVEVRFARSRDDFESILDIRRLVFQDEQGLVQNSLVDPDDASSIHVMAVVHGRTVAVGRITPPNARRPEAAIAWVATRREERGRGYGRLVLDALLETAEVREFPVVVLTAQAHAIRFYEARGFTAYGKRFDLGGVEHQQMERRMLPAP